MNKLDDKILISSMVGFGLNSNPFTEDMREFPIFYNQKVKISRAIRLAVPENYSIESFPKPQILAIPSRNVVLKHNITKINDKELAINIQFEVKDPIILSDEYQAYKELLDLFIARSNEKIVLTRN